MRLGKILPAALVFFALMLQAALPAQPEAPIGTPLVYKKLPGRELKLYVSNPPGWKVSEKRPAIVWIHGGGWTHGGPGALNNQSAYVASRGMVSIAIEYRLISKDSKEPPVVCIQDAQSAMRWVRGHAAELGIDPARIAAGGGSAGAHLSAFTGMMSGFDDPADDLKISPKPQALILFNPVIDNGPGGFGNVAMKARSMEFSPYHHVSPAAPPTLIMGGDADKLVPVAMLKEFAAKMKAAGVRCDLHIYPGGIHGFYRTDEPGRPYYSQTLLEIDRFLVSLGWLGGSPAVAVPASAEEK